jgi:Domain of unknown function (DUF1707)
MEFRNKDITPRTIRGEVEVPVEGVNILSNGTRVGHGERRGTMKHILDVKDRGYITEHEAEARINAVQQAEKAADLRSLTADLPAPFHKPGVIQSYDWDNARYWAPTLLSGMGVSAVLAIVPTAVMAQEHVFPENPVALAMGIMCILFGIIGFFACVGSIIAKS